MMSLQNLISSLARRFIARGQSKSCLKDLLEPRVSFSTRDLCCISERRKESPFLSPNPTVGGIQNNLTFTRYKKTVSRKRGNIDKEDNEEDDDDDDDDELEGENPLLVDDFLDSAADGSQNLVIDVGSLRLDAFCKSAFSIPRTKIEESFYKGDIFINGERLRKKSQDLYEGDEIDLVKQINPENRSMLDIRRVQIVKMPDKATEQGRMKVSIKRWQELTVEAYEEYKKD